MSTYSNPERVVLQALQDSAETLVPLGQYKAREDNDKGFRTTYPALARDTNEINSDSSFHKYFHPETGATITVPIEE
jgi:hypothetical protein